MLNRALVAVVTLVPKRSTLPILENIKLEPADNGVAITATDLTTQARVVIPAIDGIATCLPARQLLEFVGSAERQGEIAMS